MGCLVEARPHPAIQWYKNNTRIDTRDCEGRVEVRSSTMSPGFELSVLRVSNLSTSDYAFYHCRATNSLGVSRSHVMLHDGSGKMSLKHLLEQPPPILTPTENPRLTSFLLGMVPPLYIALYIIAYLGCYKTPQGGGGRFGTNMDQMEGNE